MITNVGPNMTTSVNLSMTTNEGLNMTTNEGLNMTTTLCLSMTTNTDISMAAIVGLNMTTHAPGWSQNDFIWFLHVFSMVVIWLYMTFRWFYIVLHGFHYHYHHHNYHDFGTVAENSHWPVFLATNVWPEIRTFDRKFQLDAPKMIPRWSQGYPRWSENEPPMVS